MTEPAKPAAAPAGGEVLDLDHLERDGVRGEFPFIHGGRTFTLSDPQEIDWQELLIALGNPVQFFRSVMPADQQAAFLTNPIPVWKVNALMERYLKHYGLPDLGGAAALPQQ